ncbi:MAG: hypothetical protein QM696_08525 [Steroidobacteraceae bacterium]
MKGGTPVLLLGMSLAACAGDSPAPQPPPAALATACLPAGDGFLHARLRGAIDADLTWSNDMMRCEGGERPDGRGLRAVIAGTLPATATGGPHSLRFIFGIDLADAAAGPAQVLPTNLTVILEGENTLFSTGGNTRCAVESLQRRPLLAGGGERIEARGYCTAPATDGSGSRRLLVPTFEFAGRITMEKTP